MNDNSSSGDVLDRRVHAYRPDLAADHLRDLVQTQNYSKGRLARVTAASARLHQGPDDNMPVETEVIFGDDVTVYEEAGNWAWVQNNRDSYVGYLPLECLSSDLHQPTHKITALSTFAYGRANIKTPLPYKLYMNSRLCIVGQDGDGLCIILQMALPTTK